MTITTRQRDFLGKLLDLYREANEPIHYSVIAERLGVTPFSAYDMMKLLEKKGLVRAVYRVATGSGRPGRSTIAFAPTSRAHAAMRLFGGWKADLSEWEETKERILRNLRTPGNEAFLARLLETIPDCSSPLLYCTETITALLLQLQQIRERAAEASTSRLRLPALRDLLPQGRMALGTLAGLGVGTLLSQRLERPSRENLLEYVGKYQHYLSQLSEEHIATLSDFLQEALLSIESASTPSSPP